MPEPTKKPRVSDPAANAGPRLTEAVENLADACISGMSREEARSYFDGRKIPLSAEARAEALELLFQVKVIAPETTVKPHFQKIEGQAVEITIWFGDEQQRTSRVSVNISEPIRQGRLPNEFELGDLDIDLAAEPGSGGNIPTIFMSAQDLGQDFEGLSPGVTYRFTALKNDPPANE